MLFCCEHFLISPGVAVNLCSHGASSTLLCCLKWSLSNLIQNEFIQSSFINCSLCLQHFNLYACSVTISTLHFLWGIFSLFVFFCKMAPVCKATYALSNVVVFHLHLIFLFLPSTTALNIFIDAMHISWIEKKQERSITAFSNMEKFRLESKGTFLHLSRFSNWLKRRKFT